MRRGRLVVKCVGNFERAPREGSRIPFVNIIRRSIPVFIVPLLKYWFEGSYLSGKACVHAMKLT